MGNAYVQGKAAPTQIGGSLSSGIFFQNLGSNPVYLGYGDQTGAAVNSTACDGVIQPGGSYRVGAKRDVWLYAEVSSGVIYSFDSGASADSGANVSVAGKVDVSGSTVAAQVSGLASRLYQNTLNVSAGSTLAVNANVQNYNSIAIQFLGYGTTVFNGIVSLIVEWFDLSGTTSIIEGIDCLLNGNGRITLQCKGDFVRVTSLPDSQATANSPAGTYSLWVSATSKLAPETCLQSDYGNLFSQRSSGMTATVDSSKDGIRSKGYQIAATTNASTGGYTMIPHWASRMTGTVYVGGTGSLSLGALLAGAGVTGALSSSLQVFPAGVNTFFDLQLPRKPLFLYHNNTAASASAFNFQAAFS